MNMCPPHWFLPSCFSRLAVSSSFLALAAGSVFVPEEAAASTLYFTGTSGDWTTANSIVWSTTATSAPSVAWTNGNAAEFVSTNPQIQTWNVNATTVTIDSGATFYTSGSTSTGRGVNINQGGSGDFTMRDDRTFGGTIFRFYLNGPSAWDGTITVNGNPTSTVGLVISGSLGGGAGSTSTATKIHLASGGALEVGPGAVSGTAVIGELSGSGVVRMPGEFASTAGTRTFQVNQSTNTTFTGTLGASLARADNILAFNKAGTGTLSIAGTGAYEGSTTVEGGHLYLSGTFGTGFTNVTGQGDYLVKSGALLGVNGTLSLSTGTNARNVRVESGGTLQPGGESVAGTMTIAGGNASSTGLVFLGASTIEFRLGTTRDSIILSGASMIGSALGGAGSVALDFLNNGGAIAGTTYDLISFGGTTQGIALNTFTLSSQSLASGWAGTFGYGGDGNLLQFTVASVPEPQVAGLCLVGCLAVLLRRRMLRTTR